MPLQFSTSIHQPSGRLVVDSVGSVVGGGGMWLDPGDRVLVFLSPFEVTNSKAAPYMGMSSVGHSLFKRFESRVGNKTVAISHGGQIVNEAICDSNILGTAALVHEDDQQAPNMAIWEHLPFVTNAITWEEMMTGARSCIGVAPILTHCPLGKP